MLTGVLNWLEIISMVITFCVTAIPATIVIIVKCKSLAAAKNEAEALQILSEISDEAKKLIVDAETVYSSIDVILKQQNDSAGTIKKETVMTKLQAYAQSKGYSFDSEYWSAEVDNIVAMTKNVNK